MTLNFDLLTSKQVHWLLVWWASSVPILGFLGLSVLELGRGTRQTDRQTDRQQDRHRLSFYNAPPLRGRGIIIYEISRNLKLTLQSESNIQWLTALKVKWQPYVLFTCHRHTSRSIRATVIYASAAGLCLQLTVDKNKGIKHDCDWSHPVVLVTK